MSAATPMSSPDHQETYRKVVDSLLSHEHVFYSPPTSPHKLHISQKSSPTIASLSLNPFLEALLHLLNCDLPAAHFLCRHAEVEPKWESMYIHGILHRIEGDVDNARCWYGDVQDKDVFRNTWEAEDAPEIASRGWEHFLDSVERYRDRSRARGGKGGWEQDDDQLDPDRVSDWQEEERLLRETSLWEMKRVLKFCEDKFGTGLVVDAKQEFLGRIESGNEAHAKVAQSMVTGGEGWRTF